MTDSMMVLMFVVSYVLLGFAFLSYSLSNSKLNPKMVPVPVRSRRTYR